MNSKNIYIVIPAFNEEKVIQDVLREIKSAGYENIVVVDDGGKDGTFAAAKQAGAAVLRHKLNRGKGAATKTGIEAAKLLGAKIIVTMDGDGQHDPKDIKTLVQPILDGRVEIVLGSRLHDPAGMPWYKIIHNWIGNVITWYLFGLWVRDSQSGFRAYSKFAADSIDTRGDRYEYDSEVLREIYLHKLKFKEVPIKVRYTAYSMGKTQKQGFLNGLVTLYKMIWKIVS